MRRAWNHALSQARARRRSRWGVLFLGVFVFGPWPARSQKMPYCSCRITKGLNSRCSLCASIKLCFIRRRGVSRQIALLTIKKRVCRSTGVSQLPHLRTTKPPSSDPAGGAAAAAHTIEAPVVTSDRTGRALLRQRRSHKASVLGVPLGTRARQDGAGQFYS